MDITFTQETDSITFVQAEEEHNFEINDYVLTVTSEEQEVTFSDKSETVNFFESDNEIVFEYGEQEIVFTIEASLTGGGGSGSGYNFINISSPSDGTDVGQDTSVTITGTTMRNSGTGNPAPNVTIDGTSVTCTPLGNDANIYQFSYDTPLEGGENNVQIVSDNNSLVVIETLTVIRDDYIDEFPPETTVSISGTEQNSWYRTIPEITLSATDDFSGVANIYYKLNGGATQTYAAPFTVSNQGSNSLEYWSEDNFGNVEEINTTSWQTDLDNPISNISITGDNHHGDWYNSETVSISISASDAQSGVSTIYISVDGSSYAEGSLYTFDTEGEHSISFYAVDIAGNEETVQTQNINIDSIAPTTTFSISGTADSGWYVSLPEVTLSTTDDTTGVNNIYYRINSGSWQVYSTPVIVSNQGSVTFEYYAEDNNGNSEAVQTETWQTDTEKPISSISITGDNYSGDWYNSSSVSINILATDTAGVDTTYISVDGNPYIEGTLHTFDTEGSHTIEYYSTDILGHTEDVKTQNINIDSIAPTTTFSISGTLDLGWYVSHPEVTLSATDSTTGVGNIYYRINGGSWQTYSTPVTVSNQGSVTFEYYAEDDNGNSEAAQTETWQTDTEAPVSSITITGNNHHGDWYNTSVDVSISATDTAGVNQTFISVDGSSYVENSIHTFDTEGSHTIEYYSTDILGHTEVPKTQNINIDTVAPTSNINVTGNQVSGWYDESPSVELTATDDTIGVDSIYYRINSGSWQTYSGIFSVHNEGTISFEYYAEDSNGNSESLNLASWQTDKTPPNSSISITGDHYSGDWYNSSTVSISISATDSNSGTSTTYISVDGGSYVENSTHTFDTEGEHTVEYYSVDVAGNVETPKTQNINIDSTLITIVDITVSQSDWYDNDGPVTFTVDVGEDTTGWTGTIDLSSFGGSSTQSLTTSGNTLYTSFTPTLQDATDTPLVDLMDRGGNTAFQNAPSLTTHLYRVPPQDVFFPPYTQTSNEVTGTFNDTSEIYCEWQEDYSRSGQLYHGTDFTIIDNNKVKLTDKWIDDVMSNSLGNLGVHVYEQ